jgi:hypothetical protein
MKINKFFFIVNLLFAFASIAQIKKGNWMMGGSASFSSSKSTQSGIDIPEKIRFSLSPNIGYFVIDKLAVGSSAQLGTETGTETGFGLGPFVRYYFLEKEKPINFFSEASYSFFRYVHNTAKYDSLNIKAGAVYFLNNSVGLEVALNYLNQKNNLDYKNNSIYLGVGFQIHLEREK